MGRTSEEQEADELQKQKDLANERVARRERLGHQTVSEPTIDND